MLKSFVINGDTIFTVPINKFCIQLKKPADTAVILNFYQKIHFQRTKIVTVSQAEHIVVEIHSTLFEYLQREGNIQSLDRFLSGIGKNWNKITCLVRKNSNFYFLKEYITSKIRIGNFDHGNNVQLNFESNHVIWC